MIVIGLEEKRAATGTVDGQTTLQEQHTGTIAVKTAGGTE